MSPDVDVESSNNREPIQVPVVYVWREHGSVDVSTGLTWLLAGTVVSVSWYGMAVFIMALVNTFAM